jgi:hypothetical protein
MRLKLTEDEEAAVFMDVLRVTKPEVAAAIYHIANERTLTRGDNRYFGKLAKMKRQGFRAGVPDYFLGLAAGDKHGLYIELKSLTGKTRPDQVTFLEEARANGYAGCFAYGADAAIEAVKIYLSGGIVPHTLPVKATRKQNGPRA